MKDEKGKIGARSVFSLHNTRIIIKRRISIQNTMAEHWRLLRDNVASIKVWTLITGAWCRYLQHWLLTCSALVMQRLQVKMIRGQNANEMSIEGDRREGTFSRTLSISRPKLLPVNRTD